MRRIFKRKPKTPKAKIIKSSGDITAKDHAQAGGHHVDLKPKGNWKKRNFLTNILLPPLFKKREGRIIKPEFPALRPKDIGLTWIGHASFLIQTAKHSMLVDPNWANWLKIVKRIRQPGLHAKDLPNIDLVMVTHAHFDHLDRRSLKRVAANQPIIVPFDVGNLVHDLGYQSVHELGYWESFEFDGVKVTLTPCHHWGARMLHDKHRGFGGFVIEAHGRTIFHCGDTAYFPGFKEIGSRFNIDVALLPIGAYDPPSGREVHMNPEQALQAMDELGAKVMVPMHYGTFKLTYEPLDEPLMRLMEGAKKHGLLDRVVVMLEGEPLIF